MEFAIGRRDGELANGDKHTWIVRKTEDVDVAMGGEEEQVNEVEKQRRMGWEGKERKGKERKEKKREKEMSGQAGKRERM